MPLVNLGDMLKHAQQHSYAVGAFGVISLDFAAGVMQAAENFRAPVILNLIESHFEFYDFDLLIPGVLAAARRAQVPVAVNLDHAGTLESAQRGILAGCNGVMVDTSLLPFDENLRLTRQVVEMAHAAGVATEGELGYVPEAAAEGGGLAYTLPAEAKAYAERSGIDCLAVSVGTVHGRMQGMPRLDYARLDRISEAVGIPLAIHGGTGLSDEQCKKLIAHGVAKINYFTALAEAAGRIVQANAGRDRAPYTLLANGVREAVCAETERCIRLWGSSGRAAEVLAQCRPWAGARFASHVAPQMMAVSTGL